jgi:hypothetical protein
LTSFAYLLYLALGLYGLANMERAIKVEPELGVPITPDINYYDLRDRAEAMCKSVELLEEHGLEVKITENDREIAGALTQAYAADSEKTSKAANTARMAVMTPESLIKIREYLDEYGRAVVNRAIEIRHTVTNRLIEESMNADPRIRIRALELLGKVSDVGLFTERSEITVTHQSTDEVRERLREKLQRLIKPSDDGPYVVEDGVDVIDVDEEFGLKPKSEPKTEPKTDE